MQWQEWGGKNWGARMWAQGHEDEPVSSMHCARWPSLIRSEEAGSRIAKEKAIVLDILTCPLVLTTFCPLPYDGYFHRTKGGGSGGCCWCLPGASRAKFCLRWHLHQMSSIDASCSLSLSLFIGLLPKCTFNFFYFFSSPSSTASLIRHRPKPPKKGKKESKAATNPLQTGWIDLLHTGQTNCNTCQSWCRCDWIWMKTYCRKSICV